MATDEEATTMPVARWLRKRIVERRRERSITLASAVILLFLLALSPSLGPGVLSAPPALDPGMVVTLDYGEVLEQALTFYSWRMGDPFYPFWLHVPQGAYLTVTIEEDAQGGCYTEGLLFDNGSLVGRTTVGPLPLSRSDSLGATLPDGEAEFDVGMYRECESWVAFPTEKTVRFEVQGYKEITVPDPVINFWADDDSLFRGACTTLRWQTENVQEVYYQGRPEVGDSSSLECPQVDTAYELYVVVYRAGEQLIDETRYVTVRVLEPPTETLTPTTTPSRTSTPTRVTRTPTRVTRTPTPTIQEVDQFGERVYAVTYERAGEAQAEGKTTTLTQRLVVYIDADTGKVSVVESH